MIHGKNLCRKSKNGKHGEINLWMQMAGFKEVKMPKKYDPEKSKMCRHRRLRKQGLKPASLEIINAIFKRNDPHCIGSLKIRELYAK